MTCYGYKKEGYCTKASIALGSVIPQVGTVAASALVFVEGAVVSAAFLRAAVVDLVVAELADVEIVAGMNFPSLCPWHLILWPLE